MSVPADHNPSVVSEVISTQDETISDNALPLTSTSSVKPSTVSETHWERFQQLKKRRFELYEKHSKRKSKRLKLSKGVNSSMTSEDSTHTHGRTYDNDEQDRATTKSTVATSWNDIRPYLSTNTQLMDGECNSDLRLQLEECIDKGRLGEATLLSDKISEQKFARQIVSAIDCHRFVERRREDEKSKRKKKPLKWKYEHKKRWEMKGNM